MTWLKIYITFFFFIFSIQYAYCNIPDSLDTKNKNSSDSSSSQAFKPIQDIALKQPIKDKGFQMKKSPWGAVWRSIVLPGWGQIYVEKYWKAPLFLAAFGTCIYLTVDNHIKFIDAADIYDKTKQANPKDPTLPLLKNRREFYRDNRDQSAFFLLGVYIISAVDAYVGAHLYDFDVSDDVTMKICPIIYQDWVKIQLIISW